MRLKEIQDIFHAELDAIFGFNEVDSFFYILIEHYFKLPRFQLVIQPDYTITEKEQNSLLKALAALKEEQPIQYIIGETEFYGLPFKVNKHVLIPRPETEELVDWVIKDIEKVSLTDKTINILDIGTGSGCIAISLAKHIKNACVYAVDVSAEALTVAKQNSGQNEVNLEFVELDILKPELWDDNFKTKTFDVIVSNPPYVTPSEESQMKPNVLQYEPHLALFVDDNNPLQFYDAICQFAVNNLEQNGKLYFEINQYLGEQMNALLKTNNFHSIELKKDLFGANRMLKATKL